jgi:hypothetical protein
MNDKSEEGGVRIMTQQMGEVWVSVCGTNSCIGSTEEESIDGIMEILESNKIQEQQPPQKVKLAAPIENPKGLGWFDGTSWGTK